MSFDFCRYLFVVLLVSLWVNLSEVFRYFVIVMPALREDLKSVPEVAPMNLLVFGIWGIWDMVLTGFVVGVSWLFMCSFGRPAWLCLAAGSFAWAGFFLLFWIGLYNMSLCSAKLPLIALPLAWLEMVVAAYLSVWLLERRNPDAQPNAAPDAGRTAPLGTS